MISKKPVNRAVSVRNFEFNIALQVKMTKKMAIEIRGMSNLW